MIPANLFSSNRRALKTIALLMSLWLLSACGSTGETIRPVTPLPTLADTPIAAAVAPTASPQPTSRLEATATVVSQLTSTANPASRSQGQSQLTLITNTPAPNLLQPGEARAIALATDVGRYGDPVDDPEPVAVQFSEFYSGFSIRTGLQFSEKLQGLTGQPVVIEGYVAPPLKPLLDFFVLTRVQLAFCPFCSTDVEWPDDIALVYMPEPDLISSEFPVRITGRMYTGSSVDAETGMVSLVRIYADKIETLN